MTISKDRMIARRIRTTTTDHGGGVDTTAMDAIAAAATDTTVEGTMLADSLRGRVAVTTTWQPQWPQKTQPAVRGTGARSATVRQVRAGTQQARGAELTLAGKAGTGFPCRFPRHGRVG